MVLTAMDPIINLEETPAKIVGRRRPPRDAFRAAMALQRLVADLQKTFQNPGIPRGVYRFKTHQEADQWILKMLTRRTAA